MKTRSLIYLSALIGIGIALSSCVSEPIGGSKKTQHEARAISGRKTAITATSLAKPDCTFAGFPYNGIVKQPAHGKIDIEHGPVHTRFDKDSADYICSGKSIEGNTIYYTSDPGFTGTDQFTLRISALHTQQTVQDATFVIHVSR